MNKEEFIEECMKLNIELDENKLNKLNKFYKMMIEWNKKINLTRITLEEEVYLKHFYDSLTLNKAINLKEINTLCDVGTGAGFPGIVLKIVFPNINITLIDSLQKRVNYLNEVIKELNLKDIKAEHFRMEDYSRLHEEEFDYITARAVANIGIISEISVRAVKLNGHMVFMKANCEDELDIFLAYCQKLGLKLENTSEFQLPFEYSNRTLVNLVKTNHTNNLYPRRIDIIKKEYN